jgi:protocatechuate 3,4-dioxygenase beta subunit
MRVLGDAPWTSRRAPRRQKTDKTGTDETGRQGFQVVQPSLLCLSEVLDWRQAHLVLRLSFHLLLRSFFFLPASSSL